MQLHNRVGDIPPERPPGRPDPGRLGPDPADPATAPVSSAELMRLLYGHEPFLAYAFDPDWNLIAGNSMLQQVVGPVAPHLCAPPINLLRLVLHPGGVSPRLDNLTEIHVHLLRRLRRKIALRRSAFLIDLEREITGYRTVDAGEQTPTERQPISMPVRLWVGPTLTSLLSSPVFFGTPWENSATAVTAECLFPADEATRDFLFAGPATITANP